MSTTHATPASHQTLDHHPRRPVRVGYLVSGLVCLGLAGCWALWAGGSVPVVALGYVVPAVLLVAGIVGIAALLISAALRHRPPRTHHAEDHETGPEPHLMDEHDPVDHPENDTKEIR